MTLDMTKGRPLKLLITFALPLMLSALLQQFYTMCDSMIVGQLLGTEAFAAVGSSSYLHWFPLSMIIGAMQGFGVLLAQRFGAGDMKAFRRAFASALWMTLALGALISVVGTVGLYPFLRLLQTPGELLEHCARYLRVLWIGLLLTAVFNLLATTLRAMGDSRTPFVALIASTVVNIALDYVLLKWLHMGAEGAALATLLSQLMSVVVCVHGVRRVQGAVPHGGEWRANSADVRELLRLGLPPLFSFGFIAVGELAVQAAINACGVVFVTGMTAARRYFELLNIVGSGLEGAVATFVGQNAGAGRHDRIIAGTRTAQRIAVISSLATGLLVILFSRPLILLFVPNAAEEIIRIGVEALCVESIFLIGLYLLCMHRAAIQGMGKPLIPMLSGFLELGLRLAAVWLLPMAAGRAGLYFTDAFTWTGTAIMLVTSYYVIRRGLKVEPAPAQEG